MTKVNPFKLIHRVLKYAVKHKHPEGRSAFTYCEDELPSRLDFGKSKYGGPFTTEQAEDVKTFFRGLGLVIIVSAVFGMMDEKKFPEGSIGCRNGRWENGILSLDVLFH